MFWFDGSIRNAVDKVKSSGVFLLVFVQVYLHYYCIINMRAGLVMCSDLQDGEDSLSKKYEDYLTEETKFQLDDYVAIKLPHNSVALQQFEQIYVSVPIPSVFIIQNNGIPLTVVSSEQVSDIQKAISDAVNKTKAKQEKKAKIQSNAEAPSKVLNGKSNEALSKPSQHVRNIGRKLFNISEEELKKRLKEIRGFPKFLLMDSGSRISLSTSTPQSARIQFRLPNNNMPSWEFPDQSTLADVRAYLMEKTSVSPSFRLLRTHPRTSFTPQDEKKTLAELSLIPTATLIVVPVEDKKVQVTVKNFLVRQSFLSSVLSTLLQPFFIVFDYFKKHILWFQNNRREETPRRLPSDTDMEKILNKKTSTSNIHAFKFEDTDSDTEHPDNGNSTQQQFRK